MLVPSIRLSRARLIAAAAAALALGVGAATLRAQSAPSGSATALYLKGADTVGTEIVTRSSTTLTGDLRFPGQPRIRWTQYLDEPGDTRTVDIEVWKPGAGAAEAPLQRLKLQVRGDSAYVFPMDASGATAAAPQAVLPAHAGAVWLVGQSVVHSSWVAQHAAGRDTAWVVMASGAQLLPAPTSARGDTLSLNLGGLQLNYLYDNDALRSATVPAQNLTVRIVGETEGAAAVAASAAPPSYAVPDGAPYTATDVTIPTPMGHSLAGTLTLPSGSPGPHAVAITISGSGAQERDERIPLVAGYALFRQVADTLGRRGIAVLRYDDRGVGGSGGNHATATSRDFANDVRAVIAWLRTRGDIDASRIALVGHSEGGLIAPMVADTDSSVAAIALLAGPAYSGARIVAFQQRNGIAEAMPTASEVERDSAFRDAQAQLATTATASPWLGEFLTYDPLRTARRVRTPVLVLQGDTDQQVTPEQADTLGVAFRAAGNRHVTVRRLRDTNHLFLRDASGAPSGYGNLTDNKPTAESMGILADWLVARLSR